MIRQIQSLAWEVPSPSHFILHLPDRADSVEVFFAGDCWLLFLDHGGDISTRAFPNRDDAMGLVAQAFHKEGMI